MMGKENRLSEADQTFEKLKNQLSVLRRNLDGLAK